MKVRTIFWLAPLLLTGCGSEEPAGPQAPRPVVTFQVEEPVAHVDRSFSGATAVVGSVEFGFEVSGRIVEIKAVSGQTYGEGTELARIDTSASLARSLGA